MLFEKSRHTEEYHSLSSLALNSTKYISKKTKNKAYMKNMRTSYMKFSFTVIVWGTYRLSSVRQGGGVPVFGRCVKHTPLYLGQGIIWTVDYHVTGSEICGAWFSMHRCKLGKAHKNVLMKHQDCRLLCCEREANYQKQI